MQNPTKKAIHILLLLKKLTSNSTSKHLFYNLLLEYGSIVHIANDRGFHNH